MCPHLTFCIIAQIFLLSLSQYEKGIKKIREDRTALNQIFSLAIMLVWALFEVLIEVAWFTRSTVVLRSSLS